MTTIREEIKRNYPNILSLENIRCILHISKRKAAWMLQHGIIKCEISEKKTKQYRVRKRDLFDYLDKLEQGDPSVLTPIGRFNTKEPKKLRVPQEVLPSIMFAKPPNDFRPWLEDEWYKVSDLLLTQDIAQLTGYDKNSVKRWIAEKRLRSVRTQNQLISTKTWLIDFYCEDAYQIVRKSDAHIKLMKRYYGIP